MSLIQPSHFEGIQNFVDSISVPSDIGHIPLKIGSGFSGFKADQFKTGSTFIPFHRCLISSPQNQWNVGITMFLLADYCVNKACLHMILI